MNLSHQGGNIVLTTRLLLASTLAGVLWFGGESTSPAQAARPRVLRITGDTEEAVKTMQEGNFKDAYEAFRRKALDPQADPKRVSEYLNMGLQCLHRLGRTNEIDGFREAVIAAHPKNWRLLQAAASSYLQWDHYGFIIAGKFERGNHRGGGQAVNSLQRDRARALQLMALALPLARLDDDHPAVADFFLSLADMLLNARGQHEAWRLQSKTDLATLPDYEQGVWWGQRQPGPAGAPVDAHGAPVYYHVPKSFEDSQNDGQRWRWCLAQAMEYDSHRDVDSQLRLATFLQSQFGVETLGGYGASLRQQEGDESGVYALHTLGEDETIARLATGVKRFKLPDEFNAIRIFRQIAGSPGTHQVDALKRLAEIFENRRQYPRAADYWRECLKVARSARSYQQRLDQIVGAWGRFEPARTQPAGQGAVVGYRFRNGRSVSFSAREINIEKLLSDVKAYLKASPKQLDWNRLNVGDLGYRLVLENQKEYVGAEVASWNLALEPRANHFDRQITVTTPLQKGGAYLLTSRMADGNTSQIVLWVADTAIVKKPLDGKILYYVADAVTGKPIAKANVEFFGWKQAQLILNQSVVLTSDYAAFTDANGIVLQDPAEKAADMQWIVIARTAESRLAYLGFTHIWFGQRYDSQYEETKVYTITDRPVYRPGQKVHFKFWIRHAKYDLADSSDFAGSLQKIEILNPKGDKIFNKPMKADAYGGIEGELDLPADAALGVYQVQIPEKGGGSFRVEEYKKPEFEVTVDAPAEPVLLGETIQATIKAKYYFGAPVTQAKVKYKVERTTYTQRWYPVGPWDWLYGSGYWWFADDYTWYPGWARWGCPRPIAVWWPHFSHQPPEVIVDREVEIGPDGTVKVEIDTGIAQAIHPDQDHQYSITAEVVDQSRRTIVGSGSVLAARKPFTVTTWVDGGHYRVGDTIGVHVAGRTLDGKPVQGQGTLQLLHVSYRDGKPVETAVQSWKLPTNKEGMAQVQARASEPGQYRLSYQLTDTKGHMIEGGYLFSILGAGFDSAQFRFNSLELIPDKREYQPGEKVRLLINTDRVGSTVLLFVRPTNGVYLTPEIIRLDGKSTVHEIGVVQRDMPNFFIEAVTVANGQTHVQAKEIVVPPEKRILNVAVLPSSDVYKPGQKATARIKLTDLQGRPFVGSTVVAIYDKSLEYISGGSNVPEIKEFFWKWRRDHSPQTETTLDRQSYNLVPPKKPAMNDLGMFGNSVAQDGETLRMGGGMGGGMAMTKSRAMMFDAVPSPAAAPMAMAESLGGGMNKAMAGGAAEPRQEQAGAAKPLVQPTVRTKFADTALWVGSLSTDATGTAQVSLEMPENLTTWRIKVWCMGHGTKVGEGFTDVVTRKDLIVRLQAPRFFVQKDEVVLSANVHNYLKQEKSVQVALELDGKTLTPTDALVRTVKIAPNGETRVDWRVKVAAEGEAVVRMKALTDEESDAMEQRFPSYVHGMLKMEARSGAIRPNEPAGKFTIDVPAQRRPEQTRLEVRFSPTLAGAMVDALPYMVDYPYGCTEQTLNRFLPTVVTQKILRELGLDLAEIRQKRTNLNAQQLGDAQQRAAQWKCLPRNPVFDADEVGRMVKEGVARLTEMQLSDGGWGWFSGWGEHSSAHTTAVVVHGLQIAQQNDVALVPGLVERGVAWLKRHQDEQVQFLQNAAKEPKPQPWKLHADDLDALVFMVLVDAGTKSPEMLAFLDRDRTHLSLYSLAMYGLALEKLGEKQKLAAVLKNLGQYVVQDDENQTAWLRLPQSNYWWCWYGSEIEVHAYYLKLLARTDPKGELASRLVKYLLNNRRHATYWNSTRDSALAVEALADFLRASGEQRPEMTVEIYFDGQLQKAVEITPQNLFSFDNQFVLEGSQVASGKHTVEFKRKGAGPLYFNGYLTNFTLEDSIAKAGLEIKVERKYYRLKRVAATVQAAGAQGQVVDEKIEKYQREKLTDLAMLKSGELVEIELEIASKNDYEYLLFEDMKPAGFEPVDVRSGYTGNALGAYVEFRDNRVAFLVASLARGQHSVAYRMRAEIPGKFHALPTRGSAMYAPELKANSDEIQLRVEDD